MQNEVPSLTKIVFQSPFIFFLMINPSFLRPVLEVTKVAFTGTYDMVVDIFLLVLFEL
jgi:hypothetical protein